MNRTAAVKATLSIAAYAGVMTIFWYLLRSYPDQIMDASMYLLFAALAAWAWSVLYHMFKGQG